MRRGYDPMLCCEICRKVNRHGFLRWDVVTVDSAHHNEKIVGFAEIYSCQKCGAERRYGFTTEKVAVNE
jgi:hypothetical protein